MTDLFQALLHFDETLGAAIAAYGDWVYAMLFVVIFSETGLVITPFLPGDSLLFAAGAFAAAGALDPWILCVFLIAAAVLGDAVNYRIGLAVGARVYAEESFLKIPVRRAYIEKTKRYYERYGAKTIVLARFIPIVRTFAPFVAGIARMPYATFARYNALGALLWVPLFVFLGYFFGNIPLVKKNFELVILAIVFISFLPPVIEFLKSRKGA